MTPKRRFTTQEIVELSLLAVLMFLGKEAMSFIPNVHSVTVIILYTVIRFGYKALLPVICFVLLEITIYGFGIWTVMYFYSWPLLVFVAMPFRKETNWLGWALLAGIFGLSFGALCSIPYIFLGGFKAAVTYWISGIPFDLIHGISGFIITLIVLPLLCKLRDKIG